VGYNVFAPHRGRGYASRAVQLLLHHLAIAGEHHTATLLVDPDNGRSLALARRLGFASAGDLDGNPHFKRPVPPLTYTDGVVTIRRQHPDDIDADLAAKDDEQIDWLWLPGQRERWEAMSAADQRRHALAGLQANHDAFGAGPKWTFSVDAADARCVAYVDCDLTNEYAPAGEANVSYASHPAHRSRGHVARAVRLLLRFLGDHTGAREAHLIIDAANAPSQRVAAAVGAEEAQRWVTNADRSMVRHVVPVPPPG
jgi:RimJ/RimL family protein N-acetyltransferase